MASNALHLKATDELRKVLDNTDLAYDDEGDVLHMVVDDAEATLRTLREMVDVEEIPQVPCSICGRTPDEHDDEECRREYED